MHDAVPPHLRKYVVEQDYAAYSARDQAVWRFVVGQTHARLRETAHPAYAEGFAAAGVSTSEIPNLRAMSARLGEAGFRVVCVDGFIPPRAFQAFQARGILPVAADIRSAAHLTYTPAPDIIHEAAGHAPFLSHPDYARFLRRIGSVSEQAFESSHDREMYRVIHLLSELKESAESTPAQLTAAERALSLLRSHAQTASEATRMARLYWWTVEYGLVGELSDYRLYGAGLLSSIGEAHFLRDPAVKKLPLSAACTELDYDITQAQPQLFVAPDFSALEAVLSDVEKTLSHVRGGEPALTAARDSGDVATIALEGGIAVIGTLSAFDAAQLTLVGACAIAHEDDVRSVSTSSDWVVPLGALTSGASLSALSPEALRAHVRGGELSLQTAGGLCVEGRIMRVHQRAGLVRVVDLEHGRVTRRGVLVAEALHYPLVLAARALTASPLVPDAFYPPSDYACNEVPRSRAHGPEEADLIALHARIDAVVERGHAGVAELSAIHARLRADHAREWLLRVNLLEALAALGVDAGPLQRAVEAELEQLEQHYQGREPIASALRSLRGPALRV